MRLLRILILPLLIVLVILARVSVIRIGPDEIGVRTLNIGQGHGIVGYDYGPGYHRNLWPLDTWNRFPSTAQRVRFAKDASGLANRPVGELRLTSADGDRVAMTAEVVFRIGDDQAHRVLQDSGPDQRYEEVVRNLAQDAIRVPFGRLRTEAFYKESSREEARKEAVAALNGRLQPRGLEVIDLLVESVQFDPNYENLIKQKKIADQQVELQKAKAKAAEETGKVNKIKAETAVKVQKVDKEAEATVTKLKTDAELQVAAMAGEAGRYSVQKSADASLYESEKKAEGQKLLKLAQAEGTLRLNMALVGEGGQNLVALEAAKTVNIADVTFPSFGYEWFNPHAMAMRLGGSAEGQVSPTTAPAVDSK